MVIRRLACFRVGWQTVFFLKPANEQQGCQCADNLGQDEAWKVGRSDARKSIAQGARDGVGAEAKSYKDGEHEAGQTSQASLAALSQTVKTKSID